MATTAPGTMDRVNQAAAWIPLVPDVQPHPFSAILLQEDLERLRRYLGRKGFLDANADYDVSVASNRRDVRVVFNVREGEPTLVRSMTLLDGNSQSGGALPESLARVCANGWAQLTRSQVGERLSDDLLADGRRALSGALADAGYPASRLDVETATDSTRRVADLTWRVSSGPRMRLGEVRIEGPRPGHEWLVVRQMGLERNEWYSRRDVEQARMQLQSVPLFQRSDVVLVDSMASDSGVAIRAVVHESRARLTNLEVGYVTDGAGITSQVRWTNPNLTGGARSFDAIALVQTGWGATSDQLDRLLRTTLTLTQPYVASPRVSLSAGPALESRDGRVDRSVSASALATLVYRINALQSAALRYDYTFRQLKELHVPGLISAAIDTLSGVDGLTDAIVDSLKTPDRIAQMVFFTSLGHLDNLSRPRHGLVFKPYLALTVPASWGNINFGKADAQLTFFVPIPGQTNALMLRGSAGGVWPFGASLPGQGLGPAVEWYRLRDQVLKAGGATDVRGYSSELLGPKYPVIETEISGTDTVLSSSRYNSIGGLRRITGSAEFRIAIPQFGPAIFGHLFTDAGRVWTTDERFHLGGLIAPDEERMFYTTGGGIGYYTPVGAIRFDVGYKLNPSTYDVRKSSDVLLVVRSGLPASAAPVVSSLRYAFHLSLGLFF